LFASPLSTHPFKPYLSLSLSLSVALPLKDAIELLKL
jgi:hypothetical protein